MLLGVTKTDDKNPLPSTGTISPSCGGSPESQLRSSYQRKLPENNVLGLIKAQRTLAVSRAWGRDGVGAGQGLGRG